MVVFRFCVLPPKRFLALFLIRRFSFSGYAIDKVFFCSRLGFLVPCSEEYSLSRSLNWVLQEKAPPLTRLVGSDPRSLVGFFLRSPDFSPWPPVGRADVLQFSSLPALKCAGLHTSSVLPCVNRTPLLLVVGLQRRISYLTPCDCLVTVESPLGVPPTFPVVGSVLPPPTISDAFRSHTGAVSGAFSRYPRV